jgi:predicted dinucleotide-binding enzyme
MSYAIIGFGKIGHALAKTFARKGIEVSVATTRDPESFAADAAAIGPRIIPKKLAEAVKADTIFLAVCFESHSDVAKALSTWKGKTIVDVTNAYGVPPEKTGRTAFFQVRRAGLYWRKAGQGLQPFGRCRPGARSGRRWGQESRVPRERR